MRCSWYLVAVLHPFDAQEDRAEEHGGYEEKDQVIAPLFLRRVNGERHGETAADEHGRVESAERDVQMVAAGGKGLGESVPVHGVAGEEAPEEHDLGDEKGPHPETRGFGLLIEVVELVGHRLVCFRQAPPPVDDSRKLPLPPPVFARSSPPAADSRSPIPVLWLSKDWDRLSVHT